MLGYLVRDRDDIWVGFLVASLRIGVQELSSTEHFSDRIV